MAIENYDQCIDYLFNQLPAFSKYGKGAIKVGLDNISKLCEALDNPHQKFKSIHIAGTNGKGSTSHMLAAIFQNSNYKTGLYTSPHIIDFKERIKINGIEIKSEWLINFLQKHKDTFDKIQPSFFEATVAIAFQYFAEMECDIVIIETGLGGRLDSTNIITPILSIITNISLDHTDILGATIKQIAEEKAGIIKPNIPFIIGQRQNETSNVFLEHSIKKHALCLYAEVQWSLVKVGSDNNYQYLKAINLYTNSIYELKCDLLGHYQLQNIITVLATLSFLKSSGWELDFTSSLNALAKTKTLTGLRGRWEQVANNPNIYIDVAHNKAGIEEVLKQWKQVPAIQKFLVLGFVKDKDINGILDILPKEYQYYCCQAKIPRALDAHALHQQCQHRNLNSVMCTSVTDAIQNVIKVAQPEDAILICGSFFILEEALNSIKHLK